MSIGIPILQIRKLRLRELKYIGQDYSAFKQLRQDLNSGGSIPEPEPVTTMLVVQHAYLHMQIKKLPFTKYLLHS